MIAHNLTKTPEWLPISFLRRVVKRRCKSSESAENSSTKRMTAETFAAAPDSASIRRTSAIVSRYDTEYPDSSSCSRADSVFILPLTEPEGLCDALPAAEISVSFFVFTVSFVSTLPDRSTTRGRPDFSTAASSANNLLAQNQLPLPKTSATVSVGTFDAASGKFNYSVPTGTIIEVSTDAGKPKTVHYTVGKISVGAA